MCVAIPSKIVEIEDLTATIEVYGARRRVSLMLLADEAEVGDYVLVHAGFAIQKVSPEEGGRTLELFDQVVKSLQDGS